MIVFAINYVFGGWTNFLAFSFDSFKLIEDSRKLFVVGFAPASLVAVLFAIIMVNGFWG